MTCFLCKKAIDPAIHGKAWEFTEGLTHQECALSALTSAAADDFLADLENADTQEPTA